MGHIEDLRSSSRRPIEANEVPYLERLGALLRELREDAGLTRAELARWAQISTAQYQRIEWAARRTRRSTLERIVRALGAAAGPDPAVTLERLIKAAGPALADESPYARRMSRRRARRARRGKYAKPGETLCPRCLESLGIGRPEVNQKRYGRDRHERVLCNVIEYGRE